MSLNFACIGVCGYIAPRHLGTIHQLGHKLLLSYDKSSVAGHIDQFFPESLFFNNFKKFKKEYLKLKKKIDYLIILTPNYTHFKYIKFALSNGSNVICEKPLVISKNHLNHIEKLEKKYNKKVHTILQLRTLNVVKKLKKEINDTKKFFNIKINYITPRGHWYKSSWKGNIKKSGGVLFNIGIHFLDLVCYLFGDYKICRLSKINETSARGEISFSRAKINFNLSIDKKDLKKNMKKKVVREFLINSKKIDLVKNFNSAHVESYKEIIFKKNFGINDVKKGIYLALNLKK